MLLPLFLTSLLWATGFAARPGRVTLAESLDEIEGSEGCNVSPEGSSPSDGLFSVVVRVKDNEGKPVADELVKLEDQGPPVLAGGSADLFGKTSSDGCLIFNEGPGEPNGYPGTILCFQHKLRLPNRPDVEPINTGCKEDAVFKYDFTVSGPIDLTPPPLGQGPQAQVCNTAPEGKTSGDLTVLARVKDSDGYPVPGELVKLSGPTTLTGRTSVDGCLVIYQDLGESTSCTDYKLSLPDRLMAAVGVSCNDAGEFEYTFMPGPVPSPPPPVSGCTAVPEDPPSGRNVLKVKVNVEDQFGQALAGEKVKLQDLGSRFIAPFVSPDFFPDKVGKTSAGGCVQFAEVTGLPPCDKFKLLLLDRPDVEPKDLGCRSSGDLEYTFVVQVVPAPPPPISERCEVIPEGSSPGGENNVTVTVRVEDTSGNPVPDEPVLLQGAKQGLVVTPPERELPAVLRGNTSAKGCLVFTYNVSELGYSGFCVLPSCNYTLSLYTRPDVPDAVLGRNLRGEVVEHTFTVAGEPPEPPIPLPIEECNVVPNTSFSEDNLTVIVRVEDNTSTPLANEPVVLVPLSGTGPESPEEIRFSPVESLVRIGRTSENGCLIIDAGPLWPDVIEDGLKFPVSACNLFALLVNQERGLSRTLEIAAQINCTNVGKGGVVQRTITGVPIAPREVVLT